MSIGSFHLLVYLPTVQLGFFFYFIINLLFYIFVFIVVILICSGDENLFSFLMT
jgi:hypothetical protein